jgi:hypothetical protein
VSVGPQMCRLYLRSASYHSLLDVIAAKGLSHWIRLSSKRVAEKAYDQGLLQFRRSIAPSHSRVSKKS